MQKNSGLLSWTWRHPVSTALLTMLLSGPVLADGTLTVALTGIAPLSGEAGCSLFASDAGFPMDASTARTVWVTVTGPGTHCVIPSVKPGTYALSVAHDVNGNHKLDTNFIGLPLEQWGVSNNVRPTLRPPRFAEAAFVMPADANNYSISIRVEK